MDPTATQCELYNETRNSKWDPHDENTLGEEISHLHSEVSEAFEALRFFGDCGVYYGADGKPMGVPIEFADVLIGLFYNAEREGFDLWTALKIKREWNKRRDYVAEGRQLHVNELESGQ